MTAKMGQVHNLVGNLLIEMGYKNANYDKTKVLDEINKLWKEMFGKENQYKRRPPRKEGINKDVLKFLQNLLNQYLD